MNLFYVITRFWPVLLILWGVSKLIERIGAPPRTPVVNGGEVAFVIVLLSIVGVIAVVTSVLNRTPFQGFDFGPFTQRYTKTTRADVASIQPDSAVAIDTRNGAINIHAGSGNGLKVLGTASAAGMDEAMARDRIRNLDVVFDGPDGDYRIHPVNDGKSTSVDLDVELPKAARITANTQRGDVSLSGMQGAGQISTRNGNIQVHDAGSSVTALSQNGDTQIHNVTGDVTLNGHGSGDINIENVSGSAEIAGNFFGDVEMRNVGKSARYTSARASVSVASLPGVLRLGTSTIELSNASGFVQISANNRDVKLENIRGPLDLRATRGDVQVVYSAAPSGPITISNDTGDVTLTLPAHSNFTISAASRSGDIENEFNSAQNRSEDSHHLQATYGSGGQAINITSNYGTIRIRKSQ